MRGRNGFTLIELLVVMAIIAMLLAIVAPRYMRQADRAKEAALRENLAGLRNSLDQYYGDKGKYPDRLQELVDDKYLRRLPVDPETGRNDSWQVLALDQGGQPGIYDVKSGATGNGMDGTAYSSW